MSHLHFVAAEEYKNRVIQLGEKPSNVFLVGGLGVDCIKSTVLLKREELENVLGIKFKQRNLLVTFHPVTLEEVRPETQLTELLASLSDLEDTALIFTLPNADPGSLALIKIIEEFVEFNPHSYALKSLGQKNYLSCIAQVDGVVGNSSSGLTEVPSFRKGTINIGSRQSGRLQATSVINCDPEEGQIRAALSKLYSSEFIRTLALTSNPYGEGGASSKVVNLIKHVSLDGIIQKSFYNI